MTVVGFAEHMKSHGQTVAIHDAAASQVGRIFVKYAKKHNLTIINVVRSEVQSKILKELGAEHVFNSSDANFDSDLKSCISELKPSIYYSAIGGGEIPSRVLNMMPLDSTCYVYGFLD